MNFDTFFSKVWRPILIAAFFLAIVAICLFAMATTSFRETGIPGRCLVYHDFRCEDRVFEYQDATHATMRLLLRNALNTPLTVHSVNATGYQGYAPACTVVPEGAIAPNSTMQITCPLVLAPDIREFAVKGEKTKYSFTVLYATENDPVLRTAAGEAADIIQ